MLTTFDFLLLFFTALFAICFLFAVHRDEIVAATFKLRQTAIGGDGSSSSSDGTNIQNASREQNTFRHYLEKEIDVFRRQGQQAFVVFSSPMCGHSRNFDGKAVAMMTAFKSIFPDMKSGFVQVQDNRELFSKEGIPGTPWLAFLKKDGQFVLDKESDRTAESVEKFIAKHYVGSSGSV